MKKFFVSISFITIFIISILYQRAPKTISLVDTNPLADVKNIPAETPLALNPVSTSISAPVSTPVASQGKYRNGTYTGVSANAYYGTVQVAAVIVSGKLSNINFLSYPSDRQHSAQLSSYALPILRQEAIAAQNASVDTISGASYTSAAFIESLSSALSQAM